MSFDRLASNQLSKGVVHLDRARNFACIRFTNNPEAASRLADRVLKAFVASKVHEEYGIEQGQLHSPLPPPNDTDIGPHVSLLHFREAPNWDVLERFEGTVLDIDALRPHEILFTGETRAAKHAFCIGVASKDIETLRTRVGLDEGLTGEGIVGMWRPQFTVAVMLKDLQPAQLQSSSSIANHRNQALTLLGLTALFAIGIWQWKRAKHRR